MNGEQGLGFACVVNLCYTHRGNDDPECVESRRFKVPVYKRLARQRGLRVLHLEAGDVENDLLIEEVRTATDDNRRTG